MAFAPTINYDYSPALWSNDRGGRSVVAIIAHNTVGTDSRGYLRRGGDRPDGSDRKVSIHVLIAKDGTIYRMLDDARAANHAGFGTLKLNGKLYAPGLINLNLVTLGFELENASDGLGRKDLYPEAQLLSMGWQINQWRAAYGPLPLFRHADVDPTRRKDTVGLSIKQIEDWAKKALPENHGTYIISGVPIYTDSQLTQFSGRKLIPGQKVSIDRVHADQPADYAPSAAHLGDDSGFIDLNTAVKL